jgi:uncharacterized membrane protein YdjX (TVP38/TMEM64 family)
MVSRRTGGSVLKIVILIAVILLLAVLQFTLDITRYLQPEAITGGLGRTGHWAPFAYMAVMALVVATPLPSLPLNIAAGAYFGPVPGTLYSVTGACGGALVSFLFARFVGREFVERYLHGHIYVCQRCSDRLLTRVVFIGRLIPAFSFDLISYGAGLTAMSARNFVVANFLGMLPLTFAYNYFGSAITIGTTLSIVLGLVFAVLFFLLPFLIERYDLFSLRRYFEHPGDRAEESHSGEGKRSPP